MASDLLPHGWSSALPDGLTGVDLLKCRQVPSSSPIPTDSEEVIDLSSFSSGHSSSSPIVRMSRQPVIVYHNCITILPGKG
ncbi:unnamed protein product [Protopolystoma xenopodis]|uniref:Uncharacterized protein n=1 Tax=Protopolystoma xenopodis TaxID=117903 RepID=A0A3S5CJL0_9PLAT|nr:unnamed protein product [Protopolystoma xenopodis]